jgi:hypothetical protein
MSGFYEVTAASVDGGGRQIPGRARNGQSDHESSRRRPHPHEGFGYHRPMTAALRPTGSAPRSSPGAHKRTARQASSYTVRSRPPRFPGGSGPADRVKRRNTCSSCSRSPSPTRVGAHGAWRQRIVKQKPAREEIVVTDGTRSRIIHSAGTMVRGFARPSRRSARHTGSKFAAPQRSGLHAEDDAMRPERFFELPEALAALARALPVKQAALVLSDHAGIDVGIQ